MRLRPWVLAALLVGGPQNAAATTGELLAAALEPQVRAAARVAPELGVHVADAVTGESLYEHQADRPLVAASNTKLVTTAAALDLLGPGYLYETRFEQRGEQLGSTLAGDLAVRGAGDPNISGRSFDGDPLAVFRGWASELARRGIRTVEGDLYLEHRRFDDERIHPDWPRNQLHRHYEAPV